MTKANYRPEIDGLRAIAVVSVLLFHTFPQILPGGFVGVDIFFVISGYLITQIIFQELQNNHFKLWNFYQRRIRRIFPALLIVFLTCTVLGWIILTPAEYELYGTHMLAGAGFVPNIIFWREAGYFDKEAITKPLLHLWSLGVEEQFYLVWPLLIGLGWKIWKPRTINVLIFAIVLLLASLGWSSYQIQHNPIADFYSPFSRFWELALGGCLALWNSKLKMAASKSVWGQMTGVALLTFSLFGLNDQIPFPGLWAIAPCAGSALILMSSGSNLSNLTSRILSLPPFVFIGLISYPLYLWHWPLISFARILEGQALSSPNKILILILSFIFACLTYYLVEKRIRSSRKTSSAIVLLLCMLLALSFGIVLRKKDGFKHRHEHVFLADPNTMVVGEQRNEILRPCQLALPISKDLDCFADKREPIRYAMLGDSKAEALYYGLTTVSSENGHWLLVDGIHPTPTGSGQDPRIAEVFESVKNTKNIQVVAIANTISSIFPLDKHTGLIPANAAAHPGQLEIWSQQIEALERANKKVVVIVDNPTFPDPTSCVSGGLTSSTVLNLIFTRKANPYCSMPYDQFLQGTQAYRSWLKELQKHHPKLVIFDTSPFLCDTNNNLCGITEGNQFLYSYSNHISDFAAKKIGLALTPLVDQLAKE